MNNRRERAKEVRTNVQASRFVDSFVAEVRTKEFLPCLKD
jgi:hypothetical protein